MKLFYTLFLTIVVWSMNAQGIEMDYTGNSPSLTLTAQYDSLENKDGKYLVGGDATIQLKRTDDDRHASLIFELSTIEPPIDEDRSDVISLTIPVERWVMGIEGDDRLRIVHREEDNLLLSDVPEKQDVLVLDANEEGSHAAPIVQIPQGRLHLGDDIKLFATAENSLLISGGDVVPSSAIADFGITQYDLGKDGLTSHWDDVVANDFVTYSLFPEIVLAKSKTSSLNVLKEITAYQSIDKKIGNATRMMLNPKELLKVFPEALHLRDVQHNADGTTEIVEIENPGIIYDRFIPLLIDGMKEQKELIDQQEAYIKSIEARLQKLEGK